MVLKSGYMIESILFFSLFFFVVISDEHTREYQDHEEIIVWYSTVRPLSNMQETYSFLDLGYCQGRKIKVDHNHESMLDALFGLELSNSGIGFTYKDNKDNYEYCSKILTESDVEFFRNAIRNDYVLEYYVDGLPLFGDVGYLRDDKYFIFNDISFIVSYNGKNIIKIMSSQTSSVELVAGNKISFTSSISWLETNIPVNDRYVFYDVRNTKIRRIGMLSSLFIVIFLIITVTLLLFRTLRNDINRYLKIEYDDDYSFNENGWKIIRKDVFRSPVIKFIFSAMCGTGFHLALAGLCSSVYSAAAESSRHNLFFGVFLLYALTSPFGGFASTYIYNVNNNLMIFLNSILSFLIFPSVFLGSTILVSIVSRTTGTTRHLEIGEFFIIVIFVPIFLIPLNLFGSYISANYFKQAQNTVSSVPKLIPKKNLLFRLCISPIFFSIIPFVSMFIELYYLFSSFWFNNPSSFYYYLPNVFVIMLATVACVSILSTYLLLNSEDYRWQWNSFCVGGFTGVYYLIYFVYYFFTKTKMTGMMQISFYFSYSTLIAISISLICGSVSFISSFIFVKKIYSCIKID